MKKRVIMFLVMIWFCLSGAVLAEDSPRLVLTYIPPWGDSSPIEGIVLGTEDFSQYRVTLYLQVTEDGEMWVKPVEAFPYTEISEDGSVTVEYATGGMDSSAVKLHLLIIPSDYTPTLHGFSSALANACDYVCITRTEDGRNDYEVPDDLMGYTEMETPSREDSVTAVGTDERTDPYLQAAPDDRQRQGSIPSEIAVGDRILLGHYEQDNDSADGTEPVEWRVLAVEDGRALLISQYGLEAKPYNELRAGMTWEDSTLRKWLNEEFYNSAFGSDEKQRIIETEISNPDNPDYGTKGGNRTDDRVFLLSIEEARTCFSDDDDRLCRLTAYSKKKVEGTILYKLIDEAHREYGYWWLRSPGYYDYYAAYVGYYGDVDTGGNDIDSTDCDGLVRPALWLSLTEKVPLKALVSSDDLASHGDGERYNGDVRRPETFTSDETAKNTISTGDIIVFGHYEQDNNPADGTEPIEWRVLQTMDYYTLVVSRYGLDTKPYHTVPGPVTWEDCSVRAWLNNEFLETAFSQQEQHNIIGVDNENGYNPDYDTAPENMTKDRIFLLSIDEAYTYFRDIDDLACRLTDTAIANGAFFSTHAGYENNGWWWLRSPGEDQSKAAFISIGGLPGTQGADVNDEGGMVRPALWLKNDFGCVICHGK